MLTTTIQKTNADVNNPVLIKYQSMSLRDWINVRPNLNLQCIVRNVSHSSLQRIPLDRNLANGNQLLYIRQRILCWHSVLNDALEYSEWRLIIGLVIEIWQPTPPQLYSAERSSENQFSRSLVCADWHALLNDNLTATKHNDDRYCNGDNKDNTVNDNEIWLPEPAIAKWYHIYQNELWWHV